MVSLDIEPDEDHPQALLSARDEAGELLGQRRVPPGYRLDRNSASRWIDSAYGQPSGT